MSNRLDLLFLAHCTKDNSDKVWGVVRDKETADNWTFHGRRGSKLVVSEPKQTNVLVPYAKLCNEKLAKGYKRVAGTWHESTIAPYK